MLQTHLWGLCVFPGLEVSFSGSPPHPARLRRSTLSKQERAFLCSVSCFRFMESLPEHSFLLSTQISHPLSSPAWRGCRPQAAGVEGTPSLLYQSPSSAPDPSLNLCVFSRLGGQLFRLPSTPGPARPCHPLQAGEGFSLSRRLYSSSPKQASQIAWHTLRNC